MTARVAAFTLLALLAFAGNSLLARAALAPGPATGAAATAGAADAPAIGPLAFTALRLAAGAAALGVLVAAGGRRRAAGGGAGVGDAIGAAGPTAGSAGTAAAHRPPTPRARTAALLPALALVAYALPFSLAYVALGAATGALLLFGSVQLTMGAAGFLRGERLDARARVGWAAAALGLAVLLLPGARAPEPWAAAAMIVAGVAWGVYSLAGRGERAPIAATARNFAWSVPLALALAAWPGAWAGASGAGVALALASGALTSGLGYAAWYVAVPALTRSAAAVVQLAVPLVAALGGVVLLGEALDARLAVAAALVLGGIAAAVLPRPALRA